MGIRLSLVGWGALVTFPFFSGLGLMLAAAWVWLWGVPLLTSCGLDGLDLSALHLPQGSYRVPEAQGYNYAFNVCGVVADEPVCRSHQGLMCQYQGTTLVAVVAQWAPGAVTWTVPTANTVVGTTANGDTCYPVSTPRTTRLVFECDPAVELQVVDLVQPPTNPCEYDLTVKTKWACQAAAPTSPSGNAALSGGWIFFIVVSVLATVYVVGGWVWNKVRHPEQTRHFPHAECWLGLCGLVKDGCRFSWQKLRGCSGGDYQPVV